jgi:hypothetical protein
VGEFAYHKRMVPKDVFSCSAPLLVEPPEALGEDFLYRTRGKKDGQSRPNEDLAPKDAKRNAYMVCNLISAINSAAKFFKDEHCGGDPDASYDKSWKQSLA